MSDYKLTPWGYKVNSDIIPDLMNEVEFINFTNGKFASSDTRIGPNIASASAAIRNFCGWHIAPSLPCAMLYNVADLRDAFVNGDLLIQLPATFVTNVSKVMLDDEVVNSDRIDYGMGDGLVRIYDVGGLDRRSKVYIEYDAGFPDTSISDIKELVASGVTRALTNSFGVASEAAGGVSISYSSTWSGKGSTALANDARQTLDAYKAKGVF